MLSETALVMFSHASSRSPSMANPSLDLEKGWSCGLMLNPEGSLKGRCAGSGFWAGLGNSYSWIDPKKGKLGHLVSQVLPFMEPSLLRLFDELERAVYGHDSSKEISEIGSNFGPFKGST